MPAARHFSLVLVFERFWLACANAAFTTIPAFHRSTMMQPESLSLTTPE
jgi:hypothetical protein